MIAEMSDDEYGLTQYAVGNLVEMLRNYLAGGSLPLFSSMDNLLGGSSSSGLMPYADDFISSGLKEMIQNKLNPFALVLLYICAYAPKNRNLAIICGVVSAVIWYLSGGKFENLKKPLGMADGNKKQVPSVVPKEKDENKQVQS